MQSPQTKGAGWVKATWIIAFIEAAMLVFLLALYALFNFGDVDGGFVVWTLIFGGLGFGVFRGSRRSAWWLVGAQWFWTARMAISVPYLVSPYVLIFYIVASVVSTVGAIHLRRISKEASRPALEEY